MQSHALQKLPNSPGSCSLPRVDSPLVVFLDKIIQLTIHLGHANLTENTNIIILIRLIVALLAFLHFQADSPPLYREIRENHADYMPFFLIYNILILLINLKLQVYKRYILTIIVNEMAKMACVIRDVSWCTHSLLFRDTGGKLSPKSGLASTILSTSHGVSLEQTFLDDRSRMPSAGCQIFSFKSLYSILSTRAWYDASIMFSETPTVPHRSFSSPDSTSTLTFAAVPFPAVSTRTL